MIETLLAWMIGLTFAAGLGLTIKIVMDIYKVDQDRADHNKES